MPARAGTIRRRCDARGAEGGLEIRVVAAGGGPAPRGVSERRNQILIAAVASRWAASLLFGLESWDPASFAVAGAALALVSLAAAWIPARRASRLAPTIALRED